MKRTVMTTVVGTLLLGSFALAGCASEAANPGPSGSASAPAAEAPVSPTSPVPSASGAAPEPSPTSSDDGGASGDDGETSDAAWTAETAHEACVEFFRAKQVSDGHDPDATVWDPFSPERVHADGASWVVDLSGDFTHDGAEYETYFSCTVAGTPEAPAVSEISI